MVAAVPGRRRSSTALAASQPSRAARRFPENTRQVPRAYNCFPGHSCGERGVRHTSFCIQLPRQRRMGAPQLEE